MPTDEQIKAEQMFIAKGICECGEHMDAHAKAFEDLATTPIKCRLMRMEVPQWNTIRRPMQGQAPR